MQDRTFSDVLDTACRAAGIVIEDDGAGDSTRRLRNAASHLQHLTDRILELAGRLSPAAASLNSYLEHETETPETRRSKPSDPKAVADELNITADMSFSDLSRLRREFALANHPDRADATVRENATLRMMVANMLIDRELKRRQSQRLSTRH